MNLLLVFGLLTVGLTALFLGGTIVAHGYLYTQPAERIPLRALVGGLLLGGFLTMWTYIDKNRPGQYDTLFEFSGTSSSEFTEFEAVRWTVGGDGKLKTDASGNAAETVVKFKRSAGGKGSSFVQEGTNEAFKLNTSEYMTGAIRVKGPNDPEPVRYSAMVKESAGGKAKTYAPERRFVEDKGSRYVEAVQLGTLFAPSTGTILGALFLNAALLGMWLAVMWPVLRYAFIHALGFAVAGTLLTMLALMPLLFKFNRPPPPKPVEAARLAVPDLAVPLHGPHARA